MLASTFPDPPRFTGFFCLSCFAAKMLCDKPHAYFLFLLSLRRMSGQNSFTTMVMVS